MNRLRFRQTRDKGARLARGSSSIDLGEPSRGKQSLEGTIPMDIWMLIAKALVSLVAIATALGGALADLVIPATAKQHMSNPHWPPHAKFHNGQTISLGVFLGLLALWFLWSPGGDQRVQFHLGVIVAALYWLSMLGASILPGTRWVDPEFAKETSTILGMPPQMFLMFVLLTSLIISEILHMF